MRIGEAIRDQHEAIVRDWTEAVRGLPHARSLSQPLLVNGIPALLDHLGDWLDRGDDRGFDGSSIAHTVDRFTAGYDLAEIVAEYSALRDVIALRVAQVIEVPRTDDLRRLHRALDLAIGDAVERFSSAKQRAIAAGESRLEALADNAPAIIFIRDYRRAAGAFVMVNHHFEELFGISRAAARGRQMEDLFPDRDPAASAEAREHDREVMERGHAMRFEERMTIDGVVTTWLAIKFPLFDTDGVAYAVCCIAIDISERKRDDEARERFISILAHDLRTPLQSIAIASQLLLADDQLEAGPRRQAAIAAKAVKRMHRMVSEVLDFARGRFGHGIPITPQVCDLAQIARATIDELQASHADRPIRLAAIGDSWGRWDEARLAQVIANLLGNAIDHGVGPVTIGIVGQADIVRVTVANQGPPIPAELADTLFEPFRRTGNSAGLGLGLFIVREIVVAHGGQIKAESDGGEVRFIVTLPRQTQRPRKPTDQPPLRPTQRIRPLRPGG